MWDHKHWEVITVYEADVIEIEASGAIESELGEGGGRGGAAAGALDCGGAAVACGAGELAGGGVGGAESATP